MNHNQVLNQFGRLKQSVDDERSGRSWTSIFLKYIVEVKEEHVCADYNSREHLVINASTELKNFAFYDENVLLRVNTEDKN